MAINPTEYRPLTQCMALDCRQGILRHGFGRWKPIVDDRQLDLKPQLRLELASIKPLPAAGPIAAAAPAPANGAASLGDGAAAAPDAAGASAEVPDDQDTTQVPCDDMPGLRG